MKDLHWHNYWKISQQRNVSSDNSHIIFLTLHSVVDTPHAYNLLTIGAMVQEYPSPVWYLDTWERNMIFLDNAAEIHDILHPILVDGSVVPNHWDVLPCQHQSFILVAIVLILPCIRWWNFPIGRGWSGAIIIFGAVMNFETIVRYWEVLCPQPEPFHIKK
jgi:hypothetical protein